MSRLLHNHDNTLPDLTSDPRIACLPLGGSTLQQWVQRRYLGGLHLKEAHIYDRGTDMPPKYQHHMEAVNAQGPDYFAVLTGRREAENYLHPDAIHEDTGAHVLVEAQNSVPEALARALHESSEAPKPWDELETKVKEDKISRAKRRLNGPVACRMTYERLRAMDPDGDIENFLREIATRLSPLHLQPAQPVETGEPEPVDVG